jgi:hypothetical protein
VANAENTTSELERMADQRMLLLAAITLTQSEHMRTVSSYGHSNNVKLIVISLGKNFIVAFLVFDIIYAFSQNRALILSLFVIIGLSKA